MIWIRAGIVAVVVALIVLAVTHSAPTEQPVVAAAAATVPPAPIQPTRVPLPPALPQMVVGRLARETAAPVATSTPSAEPRVSIVDYGYGPADLVVHAPARVTWVNTGSDGHDVTGTGPGGDSRSGPLAPQERYARQFSLPGTYNYTCSIHPEMRGVVVVVQP